MRRSAASEEARGEASFCRQNATRSMGSANRRTCCSRIVGRDSVSDRLPAAWGRRAWSRRIAVRRAPYRAQPSCGQNGAKPRRDRWLSLLPDGRLLRDVDGLGQSDAHIRVRTVAGCGVGLPNRYAVVGWVPPTVAAAPVPPLYRKDRRTDTSRSRRPRVLCVCGCRSRQLRPFTDRLTGCIDRHPYVARGRLVHRPPATR